MEAVSYFFLVPGIIVFFLGSYYLHFLPDIVKVGLPLVCRHHNLDLDELLSDIYRVVDVW